MGQGVAQIGPGGEKTRTGDSKGLERGPRNGSEPGSNGNRKCTTIDFVDPMATEKRGKKGLRTRESEFMSRGLGWGARSHLMEVGDGRSRVHVCMGTRQAYRKKIAF